MMTLQAPSEFNAKQKFWQWNFENSEDGNLVMRVGDEVRYRVRTVNFTQVTTTAKGRVATTNTEAAPVVDPNSIPVEPTRRRSTSVDLTQEEESPSAMQIVGCCNEDGLGLTGWW